MTDDNGCGGGRLDRHEAQNNGSGRGGWGSLGRETEARKVPLTYPYIGIEASGIAQSLRTGIAIGPIGRYK